MTPQIIGTRKSKGVRRCERYCSERGIEYQLRDPKEAPLGAREIQSLLQALDSAEDLIDTHAALYRTRGLAWMDYDAVEEIIEHPELLRQPIVRTDAGTSIDPDAAELKALFGR